MRKVGRLEKSGATKGRDVSRVRISIIDKHVVRTGVWETERQKQREREGGRERKRERERTWEEDNGREERVKLAETGGGGR